MMNLEERRKARAIRLAIRNGAPLDQLPTAEDVIAEAEAKDAAGDPFALAGIGKVNYNLGVKV